MMVLTIQALFAISLLTMQRRHLLRNVMLTFIVQVQLAENQPKMNRLVQVRPSSDD